MKIPFTSIYLIAFLFILSISAKAQDNDYVINNHGDTILCKIKTPAFGGDPRYQPLNAPKDDYTKISIENIKEYYLSDPQVAFRRIYKDSTGKGPNPVFMRPLERGEISIYLEDVSSSYAGAKGPYTVQSAVWFITKNSDTASAIKTAVVGIIKDSRDNRKDVLAELLKDKKGVYDKFIKDDKFKPRDIRNIIHLYNTTPK